MVKMALFLINVYQRWVSPVLPARCRYYPTCSSYGKEAIEKYGMKGIWMATKRVSRCHPWHPGGYDPVP